ncbi:MAG: MTH1187 family thiamine-binding protein [Planctomycetota bacterium]
MKVIADFCVVPLGVGVSVSKYVAACERIFARAGLKTHLHAYGTNLEGDWDAVFKAIKQCHRKLHAMGAPRITSTLRFGTRTDRTQTMADKVASVEKKLATKGTKTTK